MSRDNGVCQCFNEILGIGIPWSRAHCAGRSCQCGRERWRKCQFCRNSYRDDRELWDMLQHCFGTTDRVSREAIEAIERDIVLQMVQEFEIDLSRVLFDSSSTPSTNAPRPPSGAKAKKGVRHCTSWV